MIVFEYRLTDDAVLRPLMPWQAEEFLTNLDRAREYIAPWVGQSFVATDLPGARQVLKRYAERVADDAGGIYGIWRNDVLVGGVMFVSFDVASGACEVGCWLEPAAVGHGLITRSAEYLIDWAIRTRGISRVEWQTLSTNGPSIRVAQRLGMQRDGVLRQAVAPRGASAERQDLDIWSVLASEWRTRHRTGDPDEAAIDALTTAFFDCFTSGAGNVDAVRDLCVPAAVIVKAGPDQQIYDVDGFIEPRRRLLSSGELTDFREYETSATTRTAGDIAHRLSRYRKAGVLNGTFFEQTGTKSLQFLRTDVGWRITSVQWYDD